MTDSPDTGLAQTLITMLSSPNLAAQQWLATSPMTADDALTDDADAPAAEPYEPFDDPLDEGLAEPGGLTGEVHAATVITNPASHDSETAGMIAVGSALRRLAARGVLPNAATATLAGDITDKDGTLRGQELLASLRHACDSLELPLTDVAATHAPGHDWAITVTATGILAPDQPAVSPTWPAGHPLYLLGMTRPEYTGSTYATLHDVPEGPPTFADISWDARVATVLYDAARNGLLTSATSVDAGGIGGALGSSAWSSRMGCEISFAWLKERDRIPLTDILFAECHARALVSVAPGDEVTFELTCQEASVPVVHIGRTLAPKDGQAIVDIDGVAPINVTSYPVLA